MVPNGWKHSSFKDLIRLYRGSSPRPIVTYQTDSDEGVNWIKIGDTSDRGMIINSTSEKITLEGAKKSRKVSRGEIIVSNSMSYGKPYILNIDGYIHDGWFVLREYEEHLERNYLIQLLGSEYVQRQYKRLAAGGVVTNISSDLVYSVEVITPPLSEQKKISEILSTWDKSIEATEQLLENSRKRKKVLMQKLITGCKRTGPIQSNRVSHGGFIASKLGPLPTDWSLSLISQVAWFQEGPGVRTDQFTKTGVKLFNGTNIQNGQIELDNTNTYISPKEAYGGYAHFLVDAGDLVIACSGVSVDKFEEKVAFLKEEHLPLCMNTSTMRFKSLDSNILDIRFFAEFLKSECFKNQIRRQATGSAQLNFGPSHVEKCLIPLPPFEEQKFIAEVLSYSNREIESLQNKLSKLRFEKKALMQQLLTGKKRVKVEEVA